MNESHENPGLYPEPKLDQTVQEFFDAVVTQLLKMKSRAMAITGGQKDPSCAYRTPEGDRCAAGGQIPDHLYQQKMEKMGIRTIVDLGGLTGGGSLTDDQRRELRRYFPSPHLAMTLQMIHDDPRYWGADGMNDDGKRELISTAVANHLNHLVVV